MAQRTLTPKRERVLTLLAGLDGQSLDDEAGFAVAALRNLMGKDAPPSAQSTSMMLKEMEADGLIDRETTAGRKTYRISLTKKGLAALNGRGAAAKVAALTAEVESIGKPAPADEGFDYDALAAALLDKVTAAAVAQRDSDTEVKRKWLAAMSEAEAATKRAEKAEAQLLARGKEVLACKTTIEALEEKVRDLTLQVNDLRAKQRIPRGGSPVGERLDSKQKRALERLADDLK